MDHGLMKTVYALLAEVAKRVPTNNLMSRSVQMKKRDGISCGAGKSKDIKGLKQANRNVTESEDGKTVHAGAWRWVGPSGPDCNAERSLKLSTSPMWPMKHPLYVSASRSR